MKEPAVGPFRITRFFVVFWIISWRYIFHGEAYLALSFNSLYSTLSARACQLASIIFSETPTVPHELFSSSDWIRTLTLAAVPAFSSSTLTLKSDNRILESAG